MSHASKCLALLRKVAIRLRLVTFGRRFYVFFWLAAGVYAVGLCVSRFLGFPSDWFQPLSLTVVPAIAAVFSLFSYRRPTSRDAARHMDRYGGTKDLFLAWATLNNSAGEYQPLVQDDAETAAATVDARKVVPFQPLGRLSHLVGLALLLLLGATYLPQFDPFGKVAEARQRDRANENLRKARRATEARIAALKQRGETEKESKEVKAALDQLKTDLRKMRPADQRTNLDRLSKQQKSLGSKWRELSSEKLKKLMSQTSSRQGFGSENKLRVDQWTQQLQDGEDSALRRELEALKDAVRQAMQTADPVKRAQLARDIKQRLQALEDLATERMSSPELAAAVKRAMQQLEMAQREGLSSDSMRQAMQALQESLDLTKLELQQIAQSARDLKSLEEALKVIQMAKQVNDQERLDGEATANLESMGEYAQYYAQIMGLTGEEGLGGMGGRGFGEGGEAPEDDSVATDYQSERVKAAVRAGKVLMTLKSKGVGESGDVADEHRALIDQVRQGYSEAIMQEQIPPGYHEGIRKYFDTMAEPRAASAVGGPSDASESE